MKIRIIEPKDIRIVREAVYAGITVLLLLWLTAPFNVDTIQEHRSLFFLAQGVITVIVSIASGIFTSYILHMPMDPALPLATVHRNSVIVYFINIPVLAFALTLFGGFFFCDNPIEPWWYGGEVHFDYFFEYIYYVSVTCVFLYIGTYVRNRNWHLRYCLEEVKAINDLLEKRQKELAEREEQSITDTAEGTASPDVSPTPSYHNVSITCNSGNTTVEIPSDLIIYVESMANYADICFLDNDEPRHKTLRITLKQIMETIGDLPSFVQCHRAFIVNLNFVIAMSNRTNGYQLQLFGTDKPIPVSRNNTAAVKEKLKASPPTPLT